MHIGMPQLTSCHQNTPLAEWHKEKKAVLKDFAGWNMPFAYQGRSNVKTALHTRDHAALFDVSHMQPILYAPHRVHTHVRDE